MAKDELDMLEQIVYKVSMEGLAGYLLNYYDPQEIPDTFKSLQQAAANAQAAIMVFEDELESLMEEHDLEYS